jgi:hypothetical protein
MVDRSHRPEVLTWYYIYCALMALLYLLFLGVGVAFLFIPAEAFADQPDGALAFQFNAAVFILIGSVFTLLFGVSPFLPRRPWVWIYDLVLICLGMTSCLCLPICIPLLIFWIKAETRRYFGWQS